MIVKGTTVDPRQHADIDESPSVSSNDDSSDDEATSAPTVKEPAKKTVYPRWLAHERATGRFQRTIPLHDGLDTSNVTAKHEDGVLRVRIMKHERAKPQRITIQ